MKLVAYGREVLTPKSTHTEGFLDVVITKSINLYSNRAQFEPIDLGDVDENQIVEVVDEDGFVDITTIGKLHSESNTGASRDLSEPVVLNDLAPVRSLASAQRGKGWLKKILKVRFIDVPDLAANMTMRELTEWLEKKLMPQEGIFRCHKPEELLKVDRIQPSQQPILLLLHGTASNTAGSFGGFQREGDTSIWDKITARYNDRVYAWEHRTLSKGPIQNALELLHVIPKNTTLHLVTTSRGGLIGEVLNRASVEGSNHVGFGNEEIAAFGNPKVNNDDVNRLKEINELLEQKNIRIERYVRVACPAAGTTLASKRLDLYFKLILNLIGAIPFLRTSPIFGFTKSFLIALVKKREDISILPGLEAMMPSSTFIKVINNPTLTYNSELVVIAGDAVPKGNLLRGIKTRLIDLFYGEDNDYIVNTAAMYGGVKRTREYFFFHQHQSTNHFRYCSNIETQNAILLALEGLASKSKDFNPIDTTKQAEVKEIISQSRGSDPHAPVAIVIPGIMGSKLKAGNKKIWANKGRLFLGGMRHLNISAPEVEAYDLMGSAYADFVRSLSQSYEVTTFPYDWRKSIIESGDLLAEKVKRHLEHSEKPINLIAHSMGGLVVHSMYNRYKDLWKQFQARDGSKVLFIGSPLRGSHIIPQLLMREEHFFKILHNLDIRHSPKELLEILTDFPGILEMLPFNTKGDTAEDDIDYFDGHIYEQLDGLDAKFVKPDSARLSQAKAFAQMISSDPIEGRNIYYIAGKDNCTPVKLVEDAGKEGNYYRLLATTRGDGRVTWETGIPKNLEKSKIWYMDATHGQMCNEPEYFDAIFDILRTGSTDKLPQEEILQRGESDELFEMPTFDSVILRNEEDWEAQLLGIKPKKSGDIKALAPVKIQITHGDLGNSKFPVAIGHHKGDGIVSAERVVDNYMSGRLFNYHSAGLYPGGLQTSLVILNNDDHFEGAVILGLGDFGKLTKGDLEKTFTHGLIDLAMKHCEKGDHCRKGSNQVDRSTIGISTVLIGSRYSGLSLHESILSILSAVSNANKILQTNEVCEIKRITNVEFIELYEDIAISAARIVNELIGDDRFRQFEMTSPVLKKVSGRRQKIANVNTTDWWHRLRITEMNREHGELTKPIHFVSITDKARSEVTVLPTQRELVESLIESSVTSPRFNRNLAKTIYTLIIPNELKDFASDKRDVVLQLDKKTAEYPWELLYDPSQPGRKPISIQGGMIRQLETMNYHDHNLVQYVNQDTAYVLGDPLTPQEYKPLPGALEEAKNVETNLKNNGFSVTSSYQEDAQETIIKLFQNNYRIIHIAGHGIANKENPLKSGVVLSNGILITPAEIKQMTEIPEFVFINCCFSGDMKSDEDTLQDRNILASNLGTQFIEKGVKAIVIAGWAVDDTAAKAFSEELYEKMLDGVPFGEAVRKSRERIYRDYGNTNTWGAYQCYGDQFFVLRKGKAVGQRKEKVYIHPKEVLIDIRNLRSSSDVRSSGEAVKVLQRLDNLADQIPLNWVTRTDISEAIGSAYFELREYQKAVHYYNLLRKSDGDEFTLLGMRSLSNLYMKAALDCARTRLLNFENRATIQKYIEQSELLANWLLRLGETRYRHSLVGGNYKRKSLIVSALVNEKDEANDLRIAAMKEARLAYEKAYQLRKDNTGKDDYYSLLNWLTLEEILYFYNGNKRKLKSAEIQRMVKAAKDERLSVVGRSPGFWDSVAEAAFLGYELFSVADSSRKQEALVKQMLGIYDRAWKIGGSLRKSDNIIEHFRFVLEALELVPTSDLSRFKEEKLENIKRAFGNLYLGLGEVLDTYPEMNMINEPSNSLYLEIVKTFKSIYSKSKLKEFETFDKGLDGMATHIVEKVVEENHDIEEFSDHIEELLQELLDNRKIDWQEVFGQNGFDRRKLETYFKTKEGSAFLISF